MADYEKAAMEKYKDDKGPRRTTNSPVNNGSANAGDAHFTEKELLAVRDTQLVYDVLTRELSYKPAPLRKAMGTCTVLLMVSTIICTALVFIIGLANDCNDCGNLVDPATVTGTNVLLWRRSEATNGDAEGTFPIPTPFMNNGVVRPFTNPTSMIMSTGVSSTSHVSDTTLATVVKSANTSVVVPTVVTSTSMSSIPVTARYSKTTLLIKPTIVADKTATTDFDDGVLIVTVTSMRFVTESPHASMATGAHISIGSMMSGVHNATTGAMTGSFLNTTVTGFHSATVRGPSSSAIGFHNATALPAVPSAPITASGFTALTTSSPVIAIATAAEGESDAPTITVTPTVMVVEPRMNETDTVTVTPTAIKTAADCGDMDPTTVTVTYMILPIPVKPTTTPSIDGSLGHTTAVTVTMADDDYSETPTVIAAPSPTETDNILSDIISSPPNTTTNFQTVKPTASTTTTSLKVGTSTEADMIISEIISSDPRRITSIQVATITSESVSTISGAVPTVTTITKIGVATETVVIYTSLHPVDGNMYWMTETLTGSHFSGYRFTTTIEATEIVSTRTLGAEAMHSGETVSMPSTSVRITATVVLQPKETTTVTAHASESTVATETEVASTSSVAGDVHTVSYIPLPTLTSVMHSTSFLTSTVATVNNTVSFTATVYPNMNTTMDWTKHTVVPTATVTLANHGVDNSGSHIVPSDIGTAVTALEWPTATVPTVHTGAATSAPVGMFTLGLGLFVVAMAVFM